MRTLPPKRRSFDVFCIVRVSHRFEDLSAHVELDGDISIEPGDQVRVHGAPIELPYGAVTVERRKATVTRAFWFERMWTRFTGNFDLLSLLEVSFTDRRIS